MADVQKDTTHPGPGPDKTYRFRRASAAEQEAMLKEDVAPPPAAPFNDNEDD